MYIPKIINLDSPIDLSYTQTAFVTDVLNINIKEPKTHRKNPKELFQYLIQEIPVFLLSRQSMPRFETIIKFDGKMPSTEILGFYRHSGKILGVEKPIIGICPEKIAEHTTSVTEYVFLLAKVIVHEFAHAKLASNQRLYSPKDEFYEWMEESMANLITLEFFRDYKNKNFTNAAYSDKADAFDFVLDFVKKQPPNYRMAADFFSNNIWCWFYWMSRKVQTQKLTNEKAEFVDYAWDVYIRGGVAFDKSIMEGLLKGLGL